MYFLRDDIGFLPHITFRFYCEAVEGAKKRAIAWDRIIYVVNHKKMWTVWPDGLVEKSY